MAAVKDNVREYQEKENYIKRLDHSRYQGDYPGFITHDIFFALREFDINKPVMPHSNMAFVIFTNDAENCVLGISLAIISTQQISLTK